MTRYFSKALVISMPEFKIFMGLMTYVKASWMFHWSNLCFKNTENCQLIQAFSCPFLVSNSENCTCTFHVFLEFTSLRLLT